MVAKKKTTVKKGVASRSKKRAGKLAPAKARRGLKASEIILPLESPLLVGLLSEVRDAGGVAIGAYHEPLTGRPVLFASLPLKSIQPSPFQRDLSPTHVKRLAQKIEESGSFLDPH